MFTFSYVLPDFQKWIFRIISLSFFVGGTVVIYDVISAQLIHATWDLLIIFCINVLLCYMMCFIFWRGTKRRIHTIIDDKQIETSSPRLFNCQTLVIDWNLVIVVDMREHVTTKDWDLIIDFRYLNDTNTKIKKISMRLSMYGIDEFNKIINVIKAKDNGIRLTPHFHETEQLFLKLLNSEK
ncbi:hypothetical protein [Pedobacter cryoconitis]|uniref:Uncharacterized protein n=1 Tax=Pedobacter cryoconitis TaxID=188932 RepID=A0A327STF0_9SPHI|nr:hypothetical protein [Pedobacter cryoconitis]RAJ31024.1 hypothetical protein LY11_02253 [Pedobacter cryoconitis]